MSKYFCYDLERCEPYNAKIVDGTDCKEAVENYVSEADMYMDEPVPSDRTIMVKSMHGTQNYEKYEVTAEYTINYYVYKGKD